MSPSFRPATHPGTARPSGERPSLSHLSELVHRSMHAVPPSVLVTVGGRGEAASVDVGFWAVPSGVDHPADPLIGFLAPRSWVAIGLGTCGQLHELEPGPGGPAPRPGGEPVPVRATVLRDRAGGASSVIEREGTELQVLGEVPVGWVSDALARALGLPTPGPTESLSHVVECSWLDRIAARVLAAPGSLRRWEELAQLHPLAPTGRALPGALLAVAAEALDLESTWRRFRLAYPAYPKLPPALRPPDGRPIRPEHWFDDGSFSRWVQRNQPPAAALLQAVLEAVPAALAAELGDALITVEAPRKLRG